MKQLFRNYNFNFDSSEKKILSTMVKQILRQIEGDNRYITEIRIYQSLNEKLASSQSSIKLTKEEVKRLELQLKENAKMLKEKVNKSIFFLRWLYKPLLKQYESILNRHFNQ
ncbi:MAG: hypothetical protein ACPL25_04970 [Ignavibacteria bacterium]